MALHENNKISVFGKNIAVGTTSTNASVGSAMSDVSWKSATNRMNGSVEGIASSIDYNTALRQSSFMATILAEAIMNRFSEASVEFGTEDKTGDALENAIANWGAKFSPTNFLQANEVQTKHLDDGAVTTEKISANAVTTEKVVDKNITSDKLAENIIKDSMTVGTSKKANSVVYTTTPPTQDSPSGTFVICVTNTRPTTIFKNVLYLITV